MRDLFRFSKSLRLPAGRLMSLALALGLWVILTPGQARCVESEGRFLLVMDAPGHPSSAWDMLKKSNWVEGVVKNLQASFSLPRSLIIHFGDGPGPRYSPERVEIGIPYAFVEEVAKLLADRNAHPDATRMQNDTLDVVEWVLYHELAHAFIDLYNLPVLGREEDAADALATLLVIRLVENGGHMALTAADLLARIAANLPHAAKTSFWSEHTLDQQRFAQVVCWVYGSDTATFAPLIASGALPQRQAWRCPDVFAVMAQGWLRLLDRHIKPA